MSEAQEPRYNRVYEALVASGDDLVGLVAYSLYKQHKRDWLIRFRETENRAPNSGELNAFLLSILLPDQLGTLRQSAADALVEYAQAFVAAEEPRIWENAIVERVAQTADRIERSDRWYRQIPAGIAAALAYSILLIAVLLVLRYSGVDIESVWDRVRPAPAAIPLQ